MTQNAVEIAHFGRQKRGGGYEIKDFRGAIKRKGARLPAAKSPRRRASSPSGGSSAVPGGGRLLVVRDVVREYVRNICGCSAEMRKTWGFCKIAALSCRNRAGSREGGRVLVTADSTLSILEIVQSPAKRTA